ncbi:MBL fold metallo-hydrolase [Acidicapsa ligni]|uniref:MBL fold metallo-hydrolase n=1 Tax=Acidicapsa ligni TaxID=542300 RepID=UPI0021E08298|nr:MBL fold metallo-hydrolase [Acidicapsa ligni]
MVRFTVLASGSKGNSSIVSCLSATGGQTRILVDAGLSCRELFRRMKQVGEDPSTLDAILITHEHQDHINGLAVTARKLGIPVYFTEATHRAWVRQVTPRKRITYAEWAQQYREAKDRQQAEQEAIASHKESSELEELAAEAAADTIRCNFAPDPADERDPESEPEPEFAADQASAPVASDPATEPAKDPARLPSVEYFRPGESFAIGDIAVSPFTIPHDAADPVGFVFTAEGTRLAVATDLGYMPPNVQAQLRRCDLIMLESNHDLEMLRDGPYPWSVKQRVLSRVGHLSNDAAASFLEEIYDGSATYLILAHLSESNNHPELARIAAERALTCKPSLLANRLFLASQHEPMAPVCF